MAFVCAVPAALIGLAGMVAAVRHEEPLVVSAQGELPELPPTGVLPPDGGSPAPEPVPQPQPEPSPEKPTTAKPDTDQARPQPAPQPAPQQATPAPAEPQPASDDPYAHVEPRGTLRPTQRTPQPATKPAFDRAAYDLTTALVEMFDSGSTGRAGAKRTSANVWQVTVVAEGLVPNSDYSIIVTRPEPSYGTPGPTPCQFTATADGWGTCTGELWVTEGGRPESISLMSRAMGGSAAASGRFA